ncbi:hypothetical protein LBLM1_02165 [Limosilactobacillus mucosae LM1]|uniref:Uncharacterized protein n=1 Tax=Limosilactobacillus mucosae LM1 TaxID=1130798 RepID=A0A0D4CIP8_LIMMU|nr:hypothetical protein LBLM1_02165 [Limosilactobacillus mucosae LM1]
MEEEVETFFALVAFFFLTTLLEVVSLLDELCADLELFPHPAIKNVILKIIKIAIKLFFTFFIMCMLLNFIISVNHMGYIIANQKHIRNIFDLLNVFK